MVDRQELIHQLADALQGTPALPDYLAAAPPVLEAFDPYQLVSEWTALRQEMKQQGKLLQIAQTQGQAELERLRSQNDSLQQQLTQSQEQAARQTATDLAAQAKQFEKEQERWLQGLLNVLDALDRACAFWEDAAIVPPASPATATPPLRTQIAQWVLNWGKPIEQSRSPTDSGGLPEILSSGREGIGLIRQNLLDLLQQQQVIPIAALGQPFDSKWMYAIGREASEMPANTVIQEVTRGYLWHDRVLREAQVIVSAGSRP